MALGTEVGDAYISIHADTTPFRADLARLNRVLGNATSKNNEYAKSLERVDEAVKRNNKSHKAHAQAIRNLGDEHTRTARKVDNSRGIFEKFADNVSNRWRRMDSTVRLVLSLILAAGPQMATLGSVASSALTSLAAAAAGAMLALSPLLGVLTALVPLVIGLISPFGQWKTFIGDITSRIEDMASALSGPMFDALNRFADVFFQIFTPSNFSALFGAIASIVDGLTTTLNSVAGKDAMAAIFGPLLDTLVSIINTVTGPLLTAFLTFITATAPIAELLAVMFDRWATGIADFFTAAAESGALYEFFREMLIVLEAVFDLFGATKDVLITLFQAAVGPGTTFVGILVDLLNKWNEWMNSVEGQAALQEWFDNLFAVLPSILELLGAAGTAIADLVTPEAVEATTHLFDALSEIMPILSDVIGLLAEAGVIDVLAAALIALGEVIDPLIEPLGDFLSLLSETLIGVLEDLAPQFTLIGDAIGQLLPALAPLLPILGDLITAFVKGFAPVLPILVSSIVDVVNALMPLISQLADALMPIIPPLSDLISVMAGILGDVLVGAVQYLQPFIDALIPTFADIADLLVQLLPVFVELAQDVKDWGPVLVTANQLFLLITKALLGIIGVGIDLLGVFARLSVSLSNLLDRFVQLVLDNPILKFFQDLRTKAADTIGSIVDKIGTMATVIKNVMKAAFNGIANAWNNTIGSFSFSVPSWVPGIGGNTINVPDMPTFASGGVVNGPTFGLFGEAGAEALVPLDRPLNQVDPSVRWLSAIAQGKLGNSSTNSANVTIKTAATDPYLIASILEDSIFNNWR